MKEIGTCYTDDIIVDIFAKKGEPYFRQVEKEVVREAASRGNLVIDCGGGVAVRRLPAHRGQRRGDDGLSAEPRTLSVALVFVRRAALVCMELRHRKSFFGM